MRKTPIVSVFLGLVFTFFEYQDRPRGEAFVRGDRERLEMEKKLQEMNVKPQVFHDVSDEVQ